MVTNDVVESVDLELTCSDCRTLFVFVVEAQTFFRSKGWAQPKRCQACRKLARAVRDTQKVTHHDGQNID